MNGIRKRIEAIETALARGSVREVAESHARFIAQLDEISDAELDRLEAICVRTVEITGNKDECFFPPTKCESLSDFIAHVDADEEVYFAAVAAFLAETRR